MGWFKFWVSFGSSQSRWGLTSFMFAAAMFFLALSISFYSIYLSIIGGAIMPPFSPNLAFTLAVVTGIFGIFIGLSAVVVSIYWIFTGSKDTTDKQLKELNKGVQKLLLMSNKKDKPKGNH